MLEHLTDEQIESYRKRDLNPHQLLAADKHCLACESCRSRLNESGKLQATFNKLRENLQTAARAGPEHLEYRMLEAYVDNRADELDREIVESHLELCADCAHELAELQTFAAMLQTPAVDEVKETAQASLWQRLLAAVGLSSSAAQTGGAAAAFRLAGALALVVMIAAAAVFVAYRVMNSAPGQLAQGNTNQSAPANQNENANVPQQIQPSHPEVAQGNQNEANKNTPTPPPQPTSVVAFLVPLAISRGGGDEKSTLKLSPNVGFVDLKVEVQNSDGKNFAAQLQKIGGATHTLKTSSARNGVVSFRVAASALSNGQYYLKVFPMPRASDSSEIETVFKVEKVRQ